jgi:hypothetical protein
MLTYGAVAQLGEHLVCNQGVTGSIPVSSTSLRRFCGRLSRQPKSRAESEGTVFRTNNCLELGISSDTVKFRSVYWRRSLDVELWADVSLNPLRWERRKAGRFLTTE